jgi:endonuclease/exonuclease/phosphatase family metal-dependent hydrolase
MTLSETQSGHSITPRKELNFVQLNAENLFLFLDVYAGQDLQKMTESEWKKLSTSVTPNKPLGKTWALAKAITDIQADVVMLNEVGGLESLENFNKHFLGDQFHCQLKEGNSNRGIDVGYLIRKDLNIKTVLISHKNRPIQFLYPHEESTPAGGKSHYFSRDVAELRLFRQQENTPFLVILLTHLKSKLDPNGIDSAGRKRRAAELNTLVAIYNEVSHEVGAHTPIMVAGDFNGVVAKNGMEPEFQPLHENTNLVDILESAQVSEEDRYTQVQILHSGKILLLQIDYIFGSPKLLPAILASGSHVYRYKSELGVALAVPKNMDERDLLPSDHYPVVASLNPEFL